MRNLTILSAAAMVLTANLAHAREVKCSTLARGENRQVIVISNVDVPFLKRVQGTLLNGDPEREEYVRDLELTNAPTMKREYVFGSDDLTAVFSQDLDDQGRMKGMLFESDGPSRRIYCRFVEEQ